MKIHGASFAMFGSTYADAGKVSRQNSASSKYDMMIERIQGQIQNVNVKIQIVNQDKSLSPDEKKKEIKKLKEGLENHQAELGRTKAARTAETVMGKNEEVQKNPTINTSKTKINSNGDILELNTTALLQADNSLKNLNDTHSLEVRSEGEEDNATGEVPVDAISTSNEKTV